ncbi:hypothetical protein PITC_052240 [Penicillium italicum]|uniref:Uncharacterized protein n=1 Tax=Penicillium italicum TaxID=40296 RepID=A0A0A2KDZ2_PENIT|nr:hypothetical protein PITC_052240 [Penicillium italicum]
MRFNVIGLSALLAVAASALPVAIPDVDYVEETVWETVYETVYQTATPISAPTNVVEAVAIPSTTSETSSTWTPVTSATSIPTLSIPSITVPTVVPTPTSAPSSFTSTASSTYVAPSSTSSSPVATGSGLSIVNNLSDTVYLWVVTEVAGEMQTVAPGESFTSSTWLTNTNGGGVSIKMSTTEVCSDVLQFEYTQSGDVLFWDMSSINLLKDSIFVQAGFAVTISDASCPTSTCAPGDADCTQSYQQPDDVNTLACGIDAAYTLTLG